jgi:DNA polymerase-3 subunit epsilon
MRQIFLDTETTGLEAHNGDRLVEIGCIEMENRRLTGNTLHLYVNPERKGNEEAIRVHGLTDEFLADKPKFAEVAQQVADFIRGAELIIHNAAFDVGFLDAEFARCNLGRTAQLAGKVTDTLLMAREMFPGKANSLDALCRRLEVDNKHRTFHGALLDAGLLAEVYIRLTRGQDSLIIHHEGDDPGSPLAGQAIDLSQFMLVVPEPSAEELAVHEAQLADLDKASGGKTLWRNFSSAAV